MMLEFFGIKLTDKTGNVARAANWQERFQHLNESQHNYLRITRILKSLGELGYESFKSPLVKFILHEALVENTIPNIKQSALEYFVYTIRDRRERRKLLRFAQKHYTPSENFIWGPPRKEPADGARAQRPAAPPAGPGGQTPVHKRPKDSRSASSAAPGGGRARSPAAGMRGRGARRRSGRPKTRVLPQKKQLVIPQRRRRPRLLPKKLRKVRITAKMVKILEIQVPVMRFRHRELSGNPRTRLGKEGELPDVP
uniref:Opioid growth factor receptor like 1 n=1 Tax=Equus caballus TaxID=9796 RepID=A0A9L0RVQ4_HORSE